MSKLYLWEYQETPSINHRPTEAVDHLEVDRIYEEAKDPLGYYYYDKINWTVLMDDYPEHANQELGYWKVKGFNNGMVIWERLLVGNG